MTHPDLDVPAAVTAWLAAHAVHDADAEAAQMTQDVTVVDDGHTYVGLEQVRAWAAAVSTAFTYTATVIGTARDGDATVVTARLEGSFPGSPVELRYRFVLTGGLISSLTIGV